MSPRAERRKAASLRGILDARVREHDTAPSNAALWSTRFFRTHFMLDLI